MVNGAAQDRRRLEAIVCDRSALQKHGWRSKIDPQGFFASSRVGVGNSQRAIVDGSQSAIEGNAIRINMRMIWAMMNGVTPRSHCHDDRRARVLHAAIVVGRPARLGHWLLCRCPNAWSKSAMMSSMCSMPTERRT